MHPQFNNTPNYALIGLKLCFYNLLRNTELARVAYVMMALAKNLHFDDRSKKVVYFCVSPFGSCSYGISHSPKIPLAFLQLDRKHGGHVFYFLSKETINHRTEITKCNWE